MTQAEIDRLIRQIIRGAGAANRPPRRGRPRQRRARLLVAAALTAAWTLLVLAAPGRTIAGHCGRIPHHAGPVRRGELIT